MIEFDIRAATQTDCDQIGLIISSVWGESVINLGRILSVIQNQSHVTLVAAMGEHVAGFVDGFRTRAIDGEFRWEVDLLAVHPQFQRRGIGAGLVKANTEAGQKLGVDYARGLVAVGNAGSEKAFERCGYTSDGVVRTLFVAGRGTPSDVVNESEIEAYLIPVETMNYRGLWVEGEREIQELQAAIHHMARSHYDLAGTVVAEADNAIIHNATGLGYEPVGRFRWWERHFANG